MDHLKTLILIKNNQNKEFEDKTAEIDSINKVDNQVSVVYSGSPNNTYKYNTSNVLILKNPKPMKSENVIIYVDNFPMSNSVEILDFGQYVKVTDQYQKSSTYHKSRVIFQSSCLTSSQPRAVFNYLKQLSGLVSVMDDGRTVLLKQYEKLVNVNEQSVLAKYLSGEVLNKKESEEIPIYPFGINLSQKKAVKAALENTISIIEGPPGTGKTQTILNIIANIVSKGQTVGVVSGNNSATSNVQEKLEKNGYGFITALLGNSDKKEDFFDNRQSDCPDISMWKIESEDLQKQSERLKNVAINLETLLNDQNMIAKLKEELSKLLVEQTYFENNFKGQYLLISKFSFSKKWSSNRIMSFLAQFERLVLSNEISSIKSKASLLIQYGVYRFRYIIENKNEIIDSLKRDFYINQIEECKNRIHQLEKRLENNNYQALMKEYVDISSDLFKASLHRKYSKCSRSRYTKKSYKFKFQEFISEYPVILSTTHSIMNSISENYLFDYIIIDEASQVELVTAALALACCKNVVVVGDVKQLPQIVPTENKKLSDELFYEQQLGEAYNYSKYSIISSLMKLYGEALPITLLSEHYRCHPKIIGFCNEKYYDNQLVIMTEEKPEDKPLKMYKTAPGNHARKADCGNDRGWYNLRQIEVVRDEILDANKHKYGDCGDVGIISPYRMHVNETKKHIQYAELEVDTVHKYQGREKNTIIFTTVANDLNPFIDDPNLINVAVSRAVKELIIVTSNKLFKQHGTNLGDLIRYIEYNSLESAVIESQKISVFDLLYSEYSEVLIKYRKSSKHVSKFQSENLMYNVIEEVLELPEFKSFKCVLHVPLNSIVKDFSSFTEGEKKFAQNPWSHVDFLIFNKLDKEPVLVVEVDGVRYHRNNEEQKQRDALKDKILKKIDLPLLRIVTNESGEREKLSRALTDVIKRSSKDDNNCGE